MLSVDGATLAGAPSLPLECLSNRGSHLVDQWPFSRRGEIMHNPAKSRMICILGETKNGLEENASLIFLMILVNDSKKIVL